MKSESYRTLILADGDFPQREMLLDMLRNAGKIICCDGAADKLLDFGLMPTAVVGDLDSISARSREICADVLVHEFEQETNDLAKAFRYCREKGLTVDAVLGAAGGREDHLLGNLAQFAEFAAIFPRMRFFTEKGYFVVCRGSASFSGVEPGSAVSFIPLDPRQKLTATGVKYAFENRSFPLWYAGTLNSVAADTVTLTTDSDSPVLCFFS